MSDPEPLWSWDSLTRLFPEFSVPGGAAAAGKAAPNITGISIDSRTLAAGDLFVALAAERDGHDFIPAAVKAGAAALLARPGTQADCPVLTTPDTLAGLWQLGEAGRQRMSGTRIALTGSAGKTTLRLWLQTLLGKLGRSHASTSSYNNHLGVPLSLARMPAASQYGVFEVGANHPGEIGPLSRLVGPQVALLLNVLPAHLGNFPGMDALVKEKLSIVEGLSSGGVLVLPAGLLGQAPAFAGSTLTFGEGGDISGSAKTQGQGMRVQADVCGSRVEVPLPFAEKHRLESTLATLAALHATVPGEVESLAASFCELELPSGRGQLHQAADITLVDDSYNANPVSVCLAIEALLRQPGGRKILLLGEMLELGAAAKAAHDDVAAASEAADFVISFGDQYQETPFSNRTAHYPTVASFPLEDFVDSLKPGDQILIKGSNRVFWVHNFVKRLEAEIARRR